MGRFDLLSHVGRVLQTIVVDNVQPGTDVRLATPLEDAAGGARAVRITLLWTTPQPTHRNDPPERNLDGSIAPPPPTLSLFYLVTTYGSTDQGDAVEAHDLLGRVIRSFHAEQTIELPVDGMGEGRLSIVQLTIEPELVEKIYNPLQLRLRPWVAFEVAPVQLIRSDLAAPPEPVVRPGGVTLAPLEVLTPPQIHRISPSTVAADGQIRVDASYQGIPTRVTIGESLIMPPDVTTLDPGASVHVQLPPTLPPGNYDLTFTAANNISSARVPLTVVDEDGPSIFAPPITSHSAGSDLVLEGVGLGSNGDNREVFFWPDSGVGAPADVLQLPGTVENGGTELRIAATELTALRHTLYRVSMQSSQHQYTSYVLLEVTP